MLTCDSPSGFGLHTISVGASLVAQMVKNLTAMQETQVQSLGSDDTLEKEMATHCNILARKIQWAEESGRLQFMALHGFAKSRTSLSNFTHSLVN